MLLSSIFTGYLMLNFKMLVQSHSWCALCSIEFTLVIFFLMAHAWSIKTVLKGENDMTSAENQCMLHSFDIKYVRWNLSLKGERTILIVSWTYASVSS